MMTIGPELEAEILRYYLVEHWRCGTIAKQLNVHRDTVLRVIGQKGLPAHGRMRSSQIDPHLPFIMETLTKFPGLNARRLYDMVCERGYVGGPDQFRHQIACIRPAKPVEAFLRLRTLPGEQAQIDWAEFGKYEIGKAKRKLMCFVAVLSYSRQPYIEFFLSAKMENFLLGHIHAFELFGGVPRVLLYDNLKSLVIEREGQAFYFNKTMVDFAKHYLFETRPCAPARGNEKGRVERNVQFVRTSFFAAREFEDIEHLNAQALYWCLHRAADRPCPGDRSITVAQAFEQEKPLLRALPETPYFVEEQIAVKVAKTPYVRFDLNDYSVPHELVGRQLEVRATQEQVRIFDAERLVASHARSFSRDELIENPQHIQDLVERKRAASRHRGLNSLTVAVPECEDFLVLASKGNVNVGGLTTALLALLDRYGPIPLQEAVKEALQKGSAQMSTVRDALELHRTSRGEPPPVAIELPAHVRKKDVRVAPQDLTHYDHLIKGAKNE